MYSLTVRLSDQPDNTRYYSFAYGTPLGISNTPLVIPREDCTGSNYDSNPLPQSRLCRVHAMVRTSSNLIRNTLRLVTLEQSVYMRNGRLPAERGHGSTVQLPCSLLLASRLGSDLTVSIAPVRPESARSCSKCMTCWCSVDSWHMPYKDADSGLNTPFPHWGVEFHSS